MALFAVFVLDWVCKLFELLNCQVECWRWSGSEEIGWAHGMYMTRKWGRKVVDVHVKFKKTCFE